MKSLQARLDHQKEEVLRVAETFGRFRAMSQFGVSGYDRFVNWLKEVTGDENFGLNPKIRFHIGQTMGDQLVDAFLHKVATLETENSKLLEEVEYLRRQISGNNEKEELQTLSVLEVCQT